MRPSLKDIEIINLIRRFAMREGKDGKLITTTYCNAERLEDFAKKAATTYEC